MKRPRGRPPSSVRPIVEAFPRFDLFWLRRRGVQHRGQKGQVIWRHAPSGRTETVTYERERGGYWVTRANGARQRIEVAILPKGGGGWQPHLVCPDCDRRCRYLLAASTSRLRCRHCCAALYRSQFDDRLLTISRKRWTLRARLEERDGVARDSLDFGPGPRPKYMKRASWARIEARDAQLGDLWHADVVKRYGAVS